MGFNSAFKGLSASGKKNGKAKYNMESILELKTENL